MKRGGKLTQVDLDVHWGVDSSAAKEAFGTLTPQEFDLYAEELLLRLDESLRPFAVLKLMGYTDTEIAERPGCTERTVQRKMRLTRLAWDEAINGTT